MQEMLVVFVPGRIDLVGLEWVEIEEFDIAVEGVEGELRMERQRRNMSLVVERIVVLHGTYAVGYSFLVAWSQIAIQLSPGFECIERGSCMQESGLRQVREGWPLPLIYCDEEWEKHLQAVSFEVMRGN
jgi:hypothetical protein